MSQICLSDLKSHFLLTNWELTQADKKNLRTYSVVNTVLKVLSFIFGVPKKLYIKFWFIG